MITLPAERTDAWLRALQAALQAAAPNDDFVPMAAACAHLQALSPAIGGDLLAPSEVSESGLPAFAWMTRATAEQALDRAPSEVSEAVRQRDPVLAERMRARSRLATHLRAHTLLPALNVDAHVRRVTERTSAVLTFDHIDPLGHWVRTRVEVDGAKGQADLGLVRVDSASRITVHNGVRDVFARHVSTPILLLRAALADVSLGSISRLSRARIGPFRFPGGPGVDALPEAVQRTLILHFVQEIVGKDIATTQVNDPIDPTPLHPPKGVHAFRQRRLAVFRTGVDAVRDWLGPDVVIHPFG